MNISVLQKQFDTQGTTQGARREGSSHAVSKAIMAIWDVMPCILVNNKYHRFGGTNASVSSV